MLWGLLFLSIFPASTVDSGADVSRAHRYAVYRAHTILPMSLKDLVKRHGKFLFEGLEQGMTVPPNQVTQARVLRETEKITKLIDQQANFKAVIHQMGYVSGLVATMSDPSSGRDRRVRQGFHYYLNVKLKRFLFVFDGYPATPMRLEGLGPTLAELERKRIQYGDILDQQYRQAAYNPRFVFDERSGVFGVCSIYFSNLAGTSAQLWYHAWQNANGDMSKTPFVKNNRGKLTKKSR